MAAEPLRLVEALVADDRVGAAQIAFRRGDEATAAAYGCGEDDRLALASLTKPVLALACLAACDAGVLDLDAPARAAVPESACAGTLRDLLSHASGLPADDAAARRVQLDPASGWPEVAAAYAACAPVAAPRTRRIYSNAGYALAALMLERATGATYPVAVRDLVLAPLGCEQLRFGDDGGALEVREPGLLGHGEQLFNGARFRALGLPQSGLYGTARDYLRVLDAIADRTVADSAPMLANQGGALPGGVGSFMEWPVCDWGVGLELRDAKAPHWTGAALSTRAATHFGASGTLCLIDPERDLRAVVLANRGTYGGWMLEPGGWPDICAALAA